MSTTPHLEPLLRFLAELKQNNNKAWFDQHRPDYENARSLFAQLLDDIIDEFRASDHLLGLTGRDCIARIYRDVRFTKDKSPYKTNLAAIVAPGGWKPTSSGYYISIEPQGYTMVAGGLHEPSPEQLARFREEMDRDAAEFKQITQAEEFVKVFGGVGGERLKTAPKGYDRDHPEIALLQMKQITAGRSFADAEVLAQDFEAKAIVACRAMKPFLLYLESITQ